MKANELRIGNRVFRSFGQEWEIVTVETNDIRLAFSFENCYKPIPLTEEWLLRFGFEDTNTGAPYLELDENTKIVFPIKNTTKQIYISVWSEEDYSTETPSQEAVILTDIEYVHQLQNLYFALTGTELELKNA